MISTKEEYDFIDFAGSTKIDGDILPLRDVASKRVIRPCDFAFLFEAVLERCVLTGSVGTFHFFPWPHAITVQSIQTYIHDRFTQFYKEIPPGYDWTRWNANGRSFEDVYDDLVLNTDDDRESVRDLDYFRTGRPVRMQEVLDLYADVAKMKHVVPSVNVLDSFVRSSTGTGAPESSQYAYEYYYNRYGDNPPTRNYTTTVTGGQASVRIAGSDGWKSEYADTSTEVCIAFFEIYSYATGVDPKSELCALKVDVGFSGRERIVSTDSINAAIANVKEHYGMDGAAPSGTGSKEKLESISLANIELFCTASPRVTWQ